jgi:hypothetical protein
MKLRGVAREDNLEKYQRSGRERGISRDCFGALPLAMTNGGLFSSFGKTLGSAGGDVILVRILEKLNCYNVRVRQ